MILQFNDKGDTTKGFVSLPDVFGNILKGKQNMEAATRIASNYNKEVVGLGKSLDVFCQEQGIVNKEVKAYLASVGQAAASSNKIAQAFGGISVKAKLAEVAMRAAQFAANMLISMAISFAITKIYEGIVWLTEANKRAIESAKELANQFKETAASISGDMATIQSLSEEFSKLSSGVDQYGNNLALTSEEYDRYREIVKQILDINPTLIAGYDAQGNVLAKNRDILRETVQYLRDKAKEEAKSEVSTDSLQTLKNGFTADLGNSENELKRKTIELLDSAVFKNVDKVLSMSTLDDDSLSWFVKDRLNHHDNGAVSIRMGSLMSDENIKRVQDESQHMYSMMLKNTQLFTEKDLRYMKDYIENLNELQNGAMETKSNLVNSLLKIPQSLDDVLLNENASKVFYSLVNAIPNATLRNEDVGELRDNLIDVVNSLANDATLRNTVSQLFALDANNIPASEYQSQAVSLLKNLMEAFDSAGVPIDENKFRLLLNLDIATGVNLSEAKQKIASAFRATVGSVDALSFNQIRELYKNLDALNGLSLDEAIAQIEKLGDAGEITFTSIMNLSDKAISEFNSSINSLQSAIKDYNENQGFTVDNLQTLLFLGDEYVSLLTEENGTLAVSKDAYNALAESKFDTLKANVILNASNLINTFTNEATAVKYLTDNTRDLTNATLEANMAQLAMSYSTAQSKGGSIATAAEKVVKTLSTYLSIIDSMKDGIGNVGDANKKAKKEIDGTTTALENQSKALQRQKSLMDDDRKNIEALIDKVMAMLKQRYTDEENRIESLSKKLQEQHEEQKKILEEERDLMQEKVQAELDLLDAKEDEYKFEKELAEKNKSLAALQAKYTALELDDSEATRKLKNELLDEMSKKQTEIDEYQHDHSIDLQKDMLNKEKDKIAESYDTKVDALDAEYDKQKSVYDKQIEDIKKYTEKEVNIRKEAMALINQGGQKLYDDLIDYNRNYGNMVDADIKKLWDDAYTSIRKYQSGHYDVLAILNQIQTATTNLQSQIDALTPKIDAARVAADKLKTSIGGSGAVAGGLNNNFDELLKKLREANTEMDKSDVTLSKMKKRMDEINSPSHVLVSAATANAYKYATQGRYASGTMSVSTSGIYNVDEEGEELLLNKPSSGRYVYLSKGSGVFTAQQTKTLMGLLTNPQALVRNQLRDIKQDAAAQVIQNVGGSEVNFRGGDVYISGMTSEDTIRKFKQIQQDTVKEVFDKMAKTETIRGVKPNVMNKLF